MISIDLGVKCLSGKLRYFSLVVRNSGVLDLTKGRIFDVGGGKQ